MSSRVLGNGCKESDLLTILKNHDSATPSFLQYGLRLFDDGMIRSAITDVLRVFDFSINIQSQQNSQILMLDFEYPVVVSAQPFRRYTSFSQLKDIIPDNLADRVVAVVSPLERKMFHLDDDKPILYSIVTYLLDLFFHTPPEMYPLMDKVASVTEIWNPRTTDPFLQQAHDDMERDWQFDGLTNMCRAFRLAPNQGRDDGGGITFDHPALARLVISPLLRYLTTDIDDFFKKMETSCVVLDSDECKPNIVFDLAQHPTANLTYKGRDLADLLTSGELAVDDIDDETRIYDISKPDQLRGLFEHLVEMKGQGDGGAAVAVAVAGVLREEQKTRRRKQAVKRGTAARSTATAHRQGTAKAKAKAKVEAEAEAEVKTRRLTRSAGVSKRSLPPPRLRKKEEREEEKENRELLGCRARSGMSPPRAMITRAISG